MKILIVEDEKDLNDLLNDYIQDQYRNAEIHQVFDGIIALDHIHNHTYDLVLLDVMLPHMSGFEICRKLRETSNTPVMMLSALSDEENQLKGYNLGIDDYITKPYSPKIVIKKIESVLSRYDHKLPDQMMTYGIIDYNFEKFMIHVNKKQIELNKKEWELFTLFVRNVGRVFSREELLNLIWGYDYFGYERTVDTHIKRLRQKLVEAKDYIKTVYKTGYKFEK